MFYVSFISITLERTARDDLTPTLLGVGFFRVEAWEREGGGSGLLIWMSTRYCWRSIPGIAGSWWLHVMLITSVTPVTTTKLTVLSFPLSLSNENDFSQKGSYVSFWHQQQFKVTMTFPGWTSCCVSQWPPGQVLQLLLRRWPPCFSMQSCKKRWCLHLPTAVKNRACPGVAPSLFHHCTPWPLQALLSWAISRLEAGTASSLKFTPKLLSTLLSSGSIGGAY